MIVHSLQVCRLNFGIFIAKLQVDRSVLSRVTLCDTEIKLCLPGSDHRRHLCRSHSGQTGPEKWESTCDQRKNFTGSFKNFV